MMVSLQASLQRDMTHLNTDIKNSLQLQDNRLQSAHDEVVDTVLDHQSEITWLKTKVADLEDSTMRNNLTFRGIPESVTPQELPRYVQQLIKALLPALSELELTVDRCHRLSKLAYLHANVPRDVLARIHFYNVKEAVMAASGKLKALPYPYSTVSIYLDLSAHRILTRKDLGPITKILRDQKILYKWGNPTKILIMRQGKSAQITSLETGWKLLKNWQIVPPNSEPPVLTEPSRFQIEWSYEAGPQAPHLNR